MSDKKFILVDTETGGIDPKQHSLLQIALIALDSQLQVLGTKFWRVRWDLYRVTPDAMRVNGIHNLHKHHEKAIPESVVKSGIVAFLNTYRSAQEKYVPMGHNVNFDIGFMREFFPNWTGFFGYRSFDTQVIAQEKIFRGLIPEETGTSLADLTKHFQIENKRPHHAGYDAAATLKVLKKLLAL